MMLLNIGNVASYVFDDGDSKGPSMFLPNKWLKILSVF